LIGLLNSLKGQQSTTDQAGDIMKLTQVEAKETFLFHELVSGQYFIWEDQLYIVMNWAHSNINCFKITQLGLIAVTFEPNTEVIPVAIEEIIYSKDKAYEE
jgi:hypothetical protein